MKLALRTTAATDATLAARAAATGIKVRLVSRYCHGGIVVGDTLMHSTAAHGLCSSTFTPERWDLIDLGDSADEWVKLLFKGHEGARYDWLGLVPFIAPLPLGSDASMYCFEWCWLAMTGEYPRGLVTPEMLLKRAIDIQTKTHTLRGAG